MMNLVFQYKTKQVIPTSFGENKPSRPREQKYIKLQTELLKVKVLLSFKWGDFNVSLFLLLPNSFVQHYIF